METKLTKLKWTARKFNTENSNGHISIDLEDNNGFITIYAGMTPENDPEKTEFIKDRELTAKLIAQSPALLQVCMDLLSAFQHKEGDTKGNKVRTDIFKYCPEFGELAVKARNVIEKATL